MLQWNELRITPDGKFIILDVEVQHLSYYKDIKITSIMMNVFNKPEDFIEPIPNSYSTKLWEAPSEEDKITHVRKYIDIDTLENNLFFIYAIADGEPSEDTPCGAKDKILLGIVYNKALLYQKSIAAISSSEDCTPNKMLIDYILNVKAFELSLEIGDYKTAIRYWNNTFKDKKQSIAKCKCNGY